MFEYDRDDMISVLGRMFLTTGVDVVSLRKDMPKDTPAEVADAIIRTLESTGDVVWKETDWEMAKTIACRISEEEGIDLEPVAEAVALIEEASKIDFFENMPWLGFCPIDPCCGNFCLMTGASGASTPETVVIPRFIAYTEDGEIDFDWVEHVGNFENCGFKTMVIPKSVLFISNEFSGCSRFERFIVDERNPEYSSDEQGLLYNNKKTELYFCPNAKTSIVIPKTVVRIDESFRTSDSKLKEIIVEEGNPVFHVDENGELCDENGPFYWQPYDCGW